MTTYPTDAERYSFWSQARFTDTDCIEWSGRRSPSGYGYMHFRGKAWRAHRLAYLLAHGEIPDGALICHHCDNPPCVNAVHLYAGTNYDNMQDRKNRGRFVADAEWFRKHPPGWNAHADRRVYGERNAKAKLTVRMVSEARLLAAAGWNYQQLGQRYGVTRVAMRRAVLGITWGKPS